MTEETAIKAATIATTVVEMARDERFADMEQLFAPKLRAVASAATVRDAWLAEISKSGPVTVIGEPLLEPIQPGLVRARVPVTCEHGGLTMRIAIDSDGMLQGLLLAAPEGTAEWVPPFYVKLKKFVEHEVVVGSGPLAVQGTISLPHGRGPWPGVVLLPPMGVFDRDETSGCNKPFKDIAWGLASRGIAVLRFDMVTFTHSQQVAELRNFTMNDEYVPYGVAAIHLLQQQQSVDSTRVYILGHSMGGKVAPRVAAAEPSIAGLVIMAGDTQPMQRSAVRVTRYLAQLTSGPAVNVAVETMVRQAALVDSPDLSPTTPARDLPFGLSGAYWLDMRSYDPVATAMALEKPMLVLQGGRDYQVTVEDDLVRWKAGPGQRPDVTIRVYEADNHMFFSGSGPSTPAEYDPAQHVDPVVVADIANWIAPQQGVVARFFSLFTRHKWH